MIVKTSSGVSATFDITIDGAAVNYEAINSLNLKMNENQHDMLLIEMSGIPPRAITEYRGRPVLLKLKSGATLTDTFAGYVVEVRPVSQTSAGLNNSSPFQTAVIVCMGASYSMRGKKSKLWKDVSLASVVDELARTYGLSYDVPLSGRVLDRIAQETESDWKFLVRYANFLGYVVTCHGTHLHVFDPHKAATRSISRHQISTVSNRVVATSPGKIIKFEGVFSDDRSHSDYVVSVQTGGLLWDVVASSPSSITTSRLPEFVDTQAEAEAVLDSALKAKYDYEAKVQLVGSLGIQPGGVVAVDEYNSEFDGLWYVRGVEHNIRTGAFTTDCHLARNHQSELERVYSIEQFVSPPDPTLVGGRWRARKMAANVY